MRRPGPRSRTLRALGEPLERLAQLNIALILAQAVIVRLSRVVASQPADGGDPLVLVGFLGACVVAGVIAVFLFRAVRRFPHRGYRIALAVSSFVLQGAAFQLLHAYAS